MVSLCSNRSTCRREESDLNQGRGSRRSVAAEIQGTTVDDHFKYCLAKLLHFIEEKVVQCSVFSIQAEMQVFSLWGLNQYLEKERTFGDFFAVRSADRIGCMFVHVFVHTPVLS
jgi:hypothetical protein